MRTRYEHIIVLFYNSMSGRAASTIEEVPSLQIKIIASFEYEELARPFIIADLRKGLTQVQISHKYDVTRAVVRGIGKKIGIYK